MRKIILSILTVAALSACAATGPKYDTTALQKVPAGKAQIVLYRPFSMGGGSNPAFVINSEEKCPSLPVNSFLVLTIPAGKMSLTEKATFEQGTRFQMSVQAGQRYFVKTQPNSGAGMAFGAIGGFIDGLSHPDEGKTGRFSFEVLDQKYIGNKLDEYTSAGSCAG